MVILKKCDKCGVDFYESPFGEKVFRSRTMIGDLDLCPIHLSEFENMLCNWLKREGAKHGFRKTQG